MSNHQDIPEITVTTSGMPPGMRMQTPEAPKNNKKQILLIAAAVIGGIILLFALLKITGIIGGSTNDTKDTLFNEPQKTDDKQSDEPQSSEFVSKAFPDFKATLGKGWAAVETDNNIKIENGIPEKYITFAKGDLSLDIVLEQMVARDFFSPECTKINYYDNLKADLYRIEKAGNVDYQIGIGPNKPGFDNYKVFYQANYKALEGGNPDFSDSNFCPDGLPMGVYSSTVSWTKPLSGGVEKPESGKIEFYISSITLTGALSNEPLDDPVRDEIDELVLSITGLSKDSSNYQNYKRENPGV